jgi:tetratricopeptide (TPR) repeat protein
MPTPPLNSSNLRVEVSRLLSNAQFEAARPSLTRILDLLPADILALNQIASVSEQSGDRDAAIHYAERVIALDPRNTVAMNRLHRLGGRRPIPPPPSHHDDALGIWSWEEAFPYVDAILNQMTAGHYEWVLWTAVRDRLTTDRTAALVIEEWARQARKPTRILASEVMAGWNASITIGSDKNPYKDNYERRSDMNAYRRRRGRQRQ